VFKVTAWFGGIEQSSLWARGRSRLALAAGRDMQRSACDQ
jgi:hypothetical protein